MKKKNERTLIVKLLIENYTKFYRNGRSKKGSKKSWYSQRRRKSPWKILKRRFIQYIIFNFSLLVKFNINSRIELQDKVYKFGMRSALSAKYALGEFIVLDKVTTKSHQTAQLYDLLRKFKWGDKIIFIDTNVEKKFRLASRNIPTIDVSTLRRINILDILRKKLVIMTPRAVESLESIYHPSDSYRRSLRIEAAPSTEEQTTTKE